MLDADEADDVPPNEAEAVYQEALLMEDLGSKRGKSVLQTRVSAMKQFSAFLEAYNKENNNTTSLTVDNLRAEDVTVDLFGKFPSFLLNKPRKLALSTMMGYTSSVRAYLAETFPILNKGILEVSRTSYYHTVLFNLRRESIVAAQQSNTRLVNSAPDATLEDLRLICTNRLRLESETGLQHRCLIIWLFHALGRISEIAELSISNVKYNSLTNCLSVNIYRFKTKETQEMKLFVHKTSWLVCPIHSLACMLLLRLPSALAAPRLFSMVTSGCETSTVNGLLKEIESSVTSDVQKPLTTQVTRGLRSHSFRHGGATTLADTDGVELQDIAQRGNWRTGSLNTTFKYIGIISRGDSRAGKALSEWAPTSDGGKSPFIDALECCGEHENCREKFEQYASLLYGSVAEMEGNMKFLCTCSLVHNYPSVRSHPNMAKVIRSMLSHQRFADESMLLHWSELLDKQFKKLNYKSLDGGIICSVEDVAQMKASSNHITDMLHDASMEISAIRRDQFDTKGAVTSLESRIEGVASAISRVEAQVSHLDSAIHNLVHIVQQMIAGNLPIANSTNNPSITAMTPNSAPLMPNVPIVATSLQAPSVNTVLNSNASGLSRAEHAFRELFFTGTEYSMSKKSIFDVFHLWYDRELYKISNLSEQKARDIFGRAAKVVTYMKLFLPDHTVIRARPILDDTPESVVSLTAWKEEILNMSRFATTSAQDFLTQHGMKKNEKGHPSFSSAYKSFGKIATGYYPKKTILDECKMTKQNEESFGYKKLFPV